VREVTLRTTEQKSRRAVRVAGLVTSYTKRKPSAPLTWLSAHNPRYSACPAVSTSSISMERPSMMRLSVYWSSTVGSYWARVRILRIYCATSGAHFVHKAALEKRQGQGTLADCALAEAEDGHPLVSHASVAGATKL
jgi:hypothetical protein